jgi:hypothetical protein
VLHHRLVALLQGAAIQTRPLPEQEVVDKRRRLKEFHQTPIASVQPLCSLPFHPRQPLYAANYQRTISTSCFGFYLSISSRLSRFNLADRPRTYFLSSLLPSLLPLPTARNYCQDSCRIDQSRNNIIVACSEQLRTQRVDRKHRSEAT